MIRIRAGAPWSLDTVSGRGDKYEGLDGALRDLGEAEMGRTWVARVSLKGRLRRAVIFQVHRGEADWFKGGGAMMSVHFDSVRKKNWCLYIYMHCHVKLRENTVNAK